MHDSTKPDLSTTRKPHFPQQQASTLLATTQHNTQFSPAINSCQLQQVLDSIGYTTTFFGSCITAGFRSKPLNTTDYLAIELRVL
jgi:hypothetical protein